MTINRVFQVNGKPFFPIGGQVKNSSGYNLVSMELAWKGLEMMGANFAEIPLYWEQLEPVEGSFSFQIVDELIDEARKRKLKLVFLWFATWKNGKMDYAPAWVKADKKRFKRVIALDGQELPILSSHCRANLEADKKAFKALMNHLKQKDEHEQTVISVQVENEPGILGCDRDYGKEAEESFLSAVPAGIVEAIKREQESEVYQNWVENGAREAGTWNELFGWSAGEYMSAWSIASYIDEIAEAGKHEYQLPLFTNAWLRRSWNTPGAMYPSGGPTDNVLPIWKRATPHLDLIAPDNYITNPSRFRQMNEMYRRADNPLFIPESHVYEGNSRNLFYAIEQDALGLAVFGVERMFDEEGNVQPFAKTICDSLRSVAAIIPLILAYQGTGNVHAVVQEEEDLEKYIDFGDYAGLVKYTNDERGMGERLYSHMPGHQRGRGLIIQTGQQQFHLVGTGFKLLLSKKRHPKQMHSMGSQESRFAGYVSVEDGYFKDDGTWENLRYRNGDETDYGVLVRPGTVVRIHAGD